MAPLENLQLLENPRLCGSGAGLGCSSGVLCGRARWWAALAPDDELSELERKRLRAHLAGCGACSRFALEAAALAIAVAKAAPTTGPAPGALG